MCNYKDFCPNYSEFSAECLIEQYGSAKCIPFLLEAYHSAAGDMLVEDVMKIYKVRNDK